MSSSTTSGHDNDRGRRSVRAAVEGADRPFAVIDGGRGTTGPRESDDGDDCPITPLGHVAGNFHLLDSAGQKRELSARALGSRHDLLALFGGDDRWLRAEFPKRVKIKRKTEHGDDTEEEVVVDFVINRAAAYIQQRCFVAGLYGDHVVLRRPGIWTDEAGAPAVHCGDVVIMHPRALRAGSRTGNVIWAAAPPTARPAPGCDCSVGQHIQHELRHLWDWQQPGGEIAIVGWLGNAYLGAAPRWRPNLFAMGSSGSGKSALLAVLRALLPMHHYTTDTSKAGLEGAVNGRAMPSIVDESSDRADQRGAQALLDMVLSATGGEGTKGHRSNVDGSVRSFEIISPVAMFGVTPPDMQPQHRARFALIDLRKPAAGADNTAEHKRLAEYAAEYGAQLWGRALGAWDRYRTSLLAFRSALADAGCGPREQDQIGALLAGWWILTHEGVPDERDAREGVGALSEYTPTAVDVAADDGPRQMLDHLLTRMVQLDRSTDRDPVAALLADAWDMSEPGGRTASHAARILANYGLRAVKGGDESAQRGGPGYGVWFSNTNGELKKLFADTRWAGDRWRMEMLRLESAKRSIAPIRIGNLTTRAVWIGRDDLQME